MILGLLSDNHGHPKRLARALRLLKQNRAEAFINCGDIGGEDALAELAAAALPHCWFVWGNTDDSGPAITRFAASLGLTPPAAVPVRIDLAGRRLAVFHGHEPEFSRLDALAASGDGDALHKASAADYIFYGHTHERADRRLGRVRLINPGALHRASPRSAALLNLATDELRYLDCDEL